MWSALLFTSISIRSSQRFTLSFIIHRCLSTAEVSTALRPFYFIVHPDLFGKYPDQRIVNENSLKQLSSILEAQQSKRYQALTSLSFYLRKKHENKGTFKLVTVRVSGSNVRQTVISILNACELSTEYVDKVSKNTDKNKSHSRMFHATANPFNENDPIYTSFIMRDQVQSVRNIESLKQWISKNHDIAKSKHNATKATRNHINNLVDQLSKQYHLKEIKWDTGWNISHIRGGLQSFSSLASQHPDQMTSLSGRTLVLGQFTGVSLDGDIFLGTTEVRHNWLDLIKKVSLHDEALKKIPIYEKTLSTVLRNIHVKRRKFMPKVLAADYCHHLKRLTTSLEDIHISGGGFPPSIPKTLNSYEIVVEHEGGPLMISPTGQIITPSSFPGDQLVSFIAEHLDEAMEGLTRYKINKYTEKSLHAECIKRLQLLELLKDDCITPDKMIQCCEKLLQYASILQEMEGIVLYITSYYSILSDGVVCIPWDWKI